MTIWQLKNEKMYYNRAQERIAQEVEFELTHDDGSVQYVYGYYDNYSAVIFTKPLSDIPNDVDAWIDCDCKPDNPDSYIWRNCLFPADNLYNNECDFYLWPEASMLDVMVRLYDLNMAKSRICKASSINLD